MNILLIGGASDGIHYSWDGKYSTFQVEDPLPPEINGKPRRLRQPLNMKDVYRTASAYRVEKFRSGEEEIFFAVWSELTIECAAHMLFDKYKGTR